MRTWGLPKFLAFIAAVILIFQNCGQGFKTAESLKLKSQGLNIHISHSAGSTSPTNQSIHFEVGGEGLDGAELEWSHTLSGVGGVCNDEGAQNLEHYMVTCAQPGILHVSLLITKNGISGEATADVEISTAVPQPSPAPNDIVEFRIAAGTGQRSWNSQAQPITVFVGQTLKLINDDSIAHRLHTNGSPFPHGNEIPPGGNLSQLVQSAYSSAAAPNGSGPLYDHIYQTVTPRPDVWINAYNGATLYATNCQSCHGAIANSQNRDKTAQQIANALNTQPQMAPIRGRLTDSEIAAIAYSLKN